MNEMEPAAAVLICNSAVFNHNEMSQLNLLFRNIPTWQTKFVQDVGSANFGLTILNGCIEVSIGLCALDNSICLE